MEGVRQGQGSWKSAKINGDIYVGTYEADKKNGYGRYVWANGCIYEGGFANDLKQIFINIGTERGELRTRTEKKSKEFGRKAIW